MNTPPNIVVVVSDTLRAADLGCYGSGDVHTPNLDAFAQRSMRFTRAYPESLPTIPVRRALHTGRRAYPFRDYRPTRWDIVYLPSWQPILNDEDTLAESLAAAGYHTGFVTDTMPYFAPGFNFTRGFWQWEYVRGQQQDRWRSPFTTPDAYLARYIAPEEARRNRHGFIPMTLANKFALQAEGDTTTARVFRWAMQFLEDNRQGAPFYLLVDSFAPHEPWEAPDAYYRLYGVPDYQERRILHCGYGPAEQFGYTAEELAYVRAHYCGLVTLVDEWFGKLLDRLDALGLAENTAVFFTSDHGTNFCDNPLRVIGKPDDAMYPGVMQVPLLVRLPGSTEAAVCDELVYNLDITATVFDLAGLQSEMGIHGQSLAPLVRRTGRWASRDYVTCRYNNSLCYIDEHTWALGDIAGAVREMFDLDADPGCRVNIMAREGGARWARAWQRLLDDAGGTFADYSHFWHSDAVGREPAMKD